MVDAWTVGDLGNNGAEPPAAPANLRVDRNDGVLRLIWDDPDDSSITGYDFRARFAGEMIWRPDWTLVPGSGATTTSVASYNLGAGLTFDWEIRARNTFGPGAAASVTGTTTSSVKVRLVLTPSAICTGEAATVTATVDPALPVSFSVEVSAAPVAPATRDAYVLAGRLLEFAAEATASTGTVTITAVDNGVDDPDLQVMVTGRIADGPVTAIPVTLTIDDDATCSTSPPSVTPPPDPPAPPTPPAPSRPPAPSGQPAPPAPSAPQGLIGATPAATATELPGDRLLIQRHDVPDASLELAIGSISADCMTVVMAGVIRDESLGQTYIVVRLESDGRIVRRWVPPYSPLVSQIPWAIVNTQYTVPVGVVATIPLDDQCPQPNLLVRRFDGGDDRIFSCDADLQQWRHVPDIPTFQALGFYWCNVTAADAGFFERLSHGPPYPASEVPARDDYPNCLTS